MNDRIDPITVDEAIAMSGMTDRQMRAAGYQFLDACREVALEVLALEVERLRAEAKPQGSAWARLVAEADTKQAQPVP